MPDEQATVEQEATEDVAEAVAEVAQAPRTTRSRAQQKVEKDLTDDWVEDSDGNFTQKGE